MTSIVVEDMHGVLLPYPTYNNPYTGIIVVIFFVISFKQVI